MTHFVVDATAQVAPSLWVTTAALFAATATLIRLASPPAGVERFARAQLPATSAAAALILGLVAAVIVASIL